MNLGSWVESWIGGPVCVPKVDMNWKDEVEAETNEPWEDILDSDTWPF
ncbi:hypothetical protein ACFWAC_38400 [Streptomyces sp. NPDC059885]